MEAPGPPSATRADEGGRQHRRRATKTSWDFESKEDGDAHRTLAQPTDVAEGKQTTTPDCGHAPSTTRALAAQRRHDASPRHSCARRQVPSPVRRKEANSSILFVSDSADRDVTSRRVFRRRAAAAGARPTPRRAAVPARPRPSRTRRDEVDGSDHAGLRRGEVNRVRRHVSDARRHVPHPAPARQARASTCVLPRACAAQARTRDVVRPRVSARQRSSAPGNAPATSWRRRNSTARSPQAPSPGRPACPRDVGCRRPPQAAGEVPQVPGRPCGVRVHLTGWLHAPRSTQEHLEVRSHRWHNPPLACDLTRLHDGFPGARDARWCNTGLVLRCELSCVCCAQPEPCSCCVE